ncbi:hypothetical protein KTF24_24965, partial [Burkholderia multivorans]|uniref:hypothetical protein n=1 Tax=Burkholderia multivorans TaxID=87883 RepID=UPI001C24BBC1
GLGFLQKPDDLLFRKALLHVRLLLRKRTLLDSGWPCLQGAGHWRAIDSGLLFLSKPTRHQQALPKKFMVLVMLASHI